MNIMDKRVFMALQARDDLFVQDIEDIDDYWSKDTQLQMRKAIEAADAVLVESEGA